MNKIPDYVIWIIVLAGCIAIGAVALNVMGIAVPGWVVHVFWIVIVVIVCVAAVKFLSRNSGPS